MQTIIEFAYTNTHHIELAVALFGGLIVTVALTVALKEGK